MKLFLLIFCFSWCSFCVLATSHKRKATQEMSQVGVLQKRSRLTEPTNSEDDSRILKPLTMFAPLSTPSDVHSLDVTSEIKHGGSQVLRPSRSQYEEYMEVTAKPKALWRMLNWIYTFLLIKTACFFIEKILRKHHDQMGRARPGSKTFFF